MKGRALTVAAAALLGLGWVTPVQASPITYTEVATASGILDGTKFTDALVTFTFHGDTSNVVVDPDCALCLDNYPALSATVNVAGVGTDTFTDPVGIILVPFPSPDFGNMAGVVFVDAAPATSGLAILSTSSNALLGYDLVSSIGPVSGGAFSDVIYSTTSGNFQWTSAPATSTFTATASAVPEPATLVLVGMGLMGAAARRGRTRKR